MFGGAFAKSLGVTDNLILYLAPRILLTITMIIPTLLFGYREIKKLLLALIPGLLCFILFDKVHMAFGVYLENLAFEIEYYTMFKVMIFLFLGFVIISIILLQRINIKSELLLQTQNKELLALNKVIEGAKEIIAEKEARLSTIIESQGAALCVCEFDGEIVFSNQEASDILGKEQSGLSSNVYSYFEEEAVKKILTKVKGLKRGDKFYRELQGKNNEKGDFFIHAIFSPYFDSKGELKGVSTVFRDITSMKKAEEKLNIQRAKISTELRELQESINYAKIIQDSLFANESELKSQHKDIFLIFRPVNVVSGDFYYVKNIRNYLVSVVADCTGHGVPGGFISMLGITILDQVVQIKDVRRTEEVLEILRVKVKEAFQSVTQTFNHGMDISFSVINLTTGELQFSGANSSMIIVRNGLPIVLKGTKNPIGVHPKEIPFESSFLQLEEGDMIYKFSDGYQDQFGGPKNKKFMQKNLRNLLVDISPKPLPDQKTILSKTLEDWKGDSAQVDDITLMGIRWTGNQI